MDNNDFVCSFSCSVRGALLSPALTAIFHLCFHDVSIYYRQHWQLLFTIMSTLLILFSLILVQNGNFVQFFMDILLVTFAFFTGKQIIGIGLFDLTSFKS